MYEEKKEITLFTEDIELLNFVKNNEQVKKCVQDLAEQLGQAKISNFLKGLEQYE